MDKAKTLMIQGTGSNVGKSLLVTALCRIFLQDGYRVAPFKSQNMALNSFVTREGGEMGRAQAVQAQACLIEPHVKMNPILLKPNQEKGSQVIILGKPIGSMSVNEYIGYKKEALPFVEMAFRELAEEYDIVVLEGAGSPAEINLKDHDIVNMKMAQMAEAPVVLVGDIDKGGVFASFVGTLALLPEEEKELVKGFLINKFRGELSLLKPGLEMLTKRTGIETLGVIPYISDMVLPEEDSVEFKNKISRKNMEYEEDKVNIAIIDLPHISNFTDFDPFYLEPDVVIRIIGPRGGMGEPDALILPGSRNVIFDLCYLEERGYAKEIQRLSSQGKIIVGICGGYQMLGKEIIDPYGVESEKKAMKGMGLLSVKSIFAREKVLRQVEATHIASGLRIKGYEIHHGESSGGEKPVFHINGQPEGTMKEDGKVWGTYIHGLFDDNLFRRFFLDELRKLKGLPPLEKPQGDYDLRECFDMLAYIVRENIHIKAIYEIIQKNPKSKTPNPNEIARAKSKSIEREQE